MTVEKEAKNLLLTVGSALFRGPLIDSDFIILQECLEGKVVGYDSHNQCQIVEILIKDKPQRFYKPIPDTEENS